MIHTYRISGGYDISLPSILLKAQRCGLGGWRSLRSRLHVRWVPQTSQMGKTQDYHTQERSSDTLDMASEEERDPFSVSVPTLLWSAVNERKKQPPLRGHGAAGSERCLQPAGAYRSHSSHSSRSGLIVSSVSSAPKHLLELRGRHFGGCRWPKRLCRSHHHLRDLHGSVCAVLCAVKCCEKKMILLDIPCFRWSNCSCIVCGSLTGALLSKLCGVLNGVVSYVGTCFPQKPCSFAV